MEGWLKVKKFNSHVIVVTISVFIHFVEAL